jgi:hypothetical protein
MLGSLAEGEVLFLKGGETMVFRHNGRVETRKGGRGAPALAVALLSIGWRSFFQIQDQRQNSAYHKHDRDQQHRRRLPGSQLLNVSGQRPPQHNLSAQVRLRVSR